MSIINPIPVLSTIVHADAPHADLCSELLGAHLSLGQVRAFLLSHGIERAHVHLIYITIATDGKFSTEHKDYQL